MVHPRIPTRGYPRAVGIRKRLNLLHLYLKSFAPPPLFNPLSFWLFRHKALSSRRLALSSATLKGKFVQTRGKRTGLRVCLVLSLSAYISLCVCLVLVCDALAAEMSAAPAAKRACALALDAAASTVAFSAPVQFLSNAACRSCTSQQFWDLSTLFRNFRNSLLLGILGTLLF